MLDFPQDKLEFIILTVFLGSYYFRWILSLRFDVNPHLTEEILYKYSMYCMHKGSTTEL